ncbi:ribonuclease H-like domain-containing protein, partial [Tanacetum coccineum]
EPAVVGGARGLRRWRVGLVVEVVLCCGLTMEMMIDGSGSGDGHEIPSDDAGEVIVDHQSSDTVEEQPFYCGYTASLMDDYPIFEGNVLVFQNVPTFDSSNKTNLDSPEEVVKDINWVQAMNNKMEALYHNNTWILTDFPKNRKAIGSKWVFKIKYKSNGEIERYNKARLVAKGFGQKEGIDYDEILSHVMKMSNVRCFINMNVQNSWDLFQIDVNNAFLYGDLTEDVYMIPPLVYVDDIVITENNNDEILKFKTFLNHKFKIKDLGELKKFLGIEVLKNKNGLCLNQRKYCIELLHEYGLLACKLVATPMPENGILSHKETDNDKFLKNITSYQKIVGKLIYLYNTRPEIAYFVHCLSQHMHSPFQSHFEAVLKVLRYLKYAPGAGIVYSKSRISSISASSNSDWAKCKMTRRSVSGYYVFVFGGLVSWKSKKQATLSRSSAEAAKYRSMASAVYKVMWIVKILKDLNFTNVIPASLFCDNSSAIQIAANPVIHDKTKHFDIDVHLVREKSGIWVN